MDNDEMMKNSIRRAGRAKPGYGSNSSYQPSKGTSDENNPYMGPSPGPFMDIPPKEHQAGSGGKKANMQRPFHADFM